MRAVCGRLSDVASHAPVQIFLAATLAGCTGWVVGLAKLLQVMMTAEDGLFPTKSEAAAQSFLITFGMSKAVSNMFVGSAADTYGRKPCMLLGWLAGILHYAAVVGSDSWSGIVWSNLLLGINQGCCWSAALFFLVDIFGRHHTAFAIGLCETVGYLGVALASPVVSASSHDASVVRQWYTVLLGTCGVGLVLTLCLCETKARAHSEIVAADEPGGGGGGGGDGADGEPATPSARRHRATIVWPSGGRTEKPLSRVICAYVSCIDLPLVSCCAVGVVLNFSSAFAWGAMTRWLTQLGSPTKTSSGFVLLAYSLPKGIVQATLRPMLPHQLHPILLIHLWILFVLSF